MIRIVASETESARHGMRVGRITGHDVLREASDAVMNDRFDLVIARIPCDEASEGAVEGAAGGDAIAARPDVTVFDCGILVTYEGSLRPHPDHDLVPIREWSPADTRLVLEIFSGYRNHVARNPLLDPTVVPLGYAEWAEAHVRDDPSGACFRLLDGTGETAGFAALSAHERTVSISLAGVVPMKRGRGVYRRLLDALEGAALAMGHDRVRISTQLENTTPQRAWQERGWQVVLRERILHVARTDPTG